jgi:hypothetical protein
VEDRERERERERSGREKVKGENHTISNILMQLILIQSPSWDILRLITIFNRKIIYSTRYPNNVRKSQYRYLLFIEAFYPKK